MKESYKRKCYNLKVESLSNPIGLEPGPVRLSWLHPQLADSDARVEAVQVRAAYTQTAIAKEEDILWDSGEIGEGDLFSMLVPQLQVEPGKSVYGSVRCRVEGEEEWRPWSEAARWEFGSGANEEDWEGSQWIARELPQPVVPRPVTALLRKCFSLDAASPVVRARLYVATPGFCYVWLNEREVMDKMCDPMRADSTKTVHYRTFDVTHVVNEVTTPDRKRELAMGIWLASGFYSPWNQCSEHPMPVVRGLVVIEYEDGRVQRLGTDSSWKTAESPIQLTAAYEKFGTFGGEVWDMRADPGDWFKSDYCDAHWAQASEVKAPSGRLKAQPGLAHAIQEVLKPVETTHTDGGRIVIDFGKSITGRVRMRFKPKPRLGVAQRLRVRHLESLSGVTAAKVQNPNEMVDFGQVHEWHAFPKGEPLHCHFHALPKNTWVEWTPRFHIYCFRYIEIEAIGMDFPEDGSGIEAEFWITEFEQTAQFASDDALINRIDSASRETLRCLSIYGGLLDCPHREKQGWGAEAQANLEHLLYQFNSAEFWRRFLADWRDSQRADGSLPSLAPDCRCSENAGGPVWGCASVTLAWGAYVYSGDKRILEENFSMIEGWLSFLEDKLVDGRLNAEAYVGQKLGEFNPTSFIGDWLPPKSTWIDQYPILDLFNRTGKGALFDTEAARAAIAASEVYSMLVALYVFKLARKIAELLEHGDAAERWSQTIATMSEACLKDWVDSETGVVCNGRQAYAALALLADPFAEGFSPEKAKKVRARVLETLCHRIELKDHDHFDTGVLATTVLLKVLCLHGKVDLALGMFQQRDYPSFQHMFDQGCTTIPECWNGKGGSLCHASFSGAGFWFYQALGGIVPDEATPGFRKFKLAPQLTQKLEKVSVAYRSPVGLIRSEWKWQDEARTRLVYECEVPSGAEAEFQIPSNRTLQDRVPERLRGGMHRFALEWNAANEFQSNAIMETTA